MTKAVSSVGRALGGVVSGAVKAVSGIAKNVGGLVKSIASSKLGKAVMIAAAIYFGGAALSGGFSSMGAGGSFFSGMGTGVANAASSLSTAWTSAMSGNFSQAGSALSSGFSGESYAANAFGPTSANAGFGGGNMSANAVTTSGAPVVQPPPGAGTFGANTVNGAAVSTPGAAPGTVLTTPVTAPVIPPAVPPNGAPLSTWDKIVSSPYTAPALISGGMQVGGAYIQGQAQEKQLREQREYEERMAREARDRYNTNAGATLFAADQAPIYQSDQAAFDPLAEARARNAARYAPRPTGVVARYMPTTA